MHALDPRSSLLNIAASVHATVIERLRLDTLQEQRSEIVAGGLARLWNESVKVGVFETPAIFIDREGNVEVGVAGKFLNRDDSQISVLNLLSRVTQKREIFELVGYGDELHVFGLPGQFEGNGGIYNVAPSVVEFHQPPANYPLASIEEVSSNYWEEANAKRGMTYRLARAVDDSLPIEFPECSLEEAQLSSVRRVAQPQAVHEAFAKWNGISFEMDSGIPVRTNPKLVELMVDLHHLAASSVETGGGPFAAAVISPEGKIISFGVNRVVPGCNALAHGEQSAMSEALYSIQQQYNGNEEEFPTNLRGCTVVTSSMTCISCAEQAGLYGITALIYDNTKSEIESRTIFTEGPLELIASSTAPEGDCSTLDGILVLRVTCGDDEIRFKGFDDFMSAIGQDPKRSYLSDRSQEDLDAAEGISF